MKLSRTRNHRRRSAIGLAILLYAPAASPVVANGDGIEVVHATAYVQISLADWRSDLPAGASLVVPSGGLVNNGFPALSSDGSKIAIFHRASHPMEKAYPTLDIYSTSSLQLQERIELLERYEHGHGSGLDDQSVLDRVRQSVQKINELMAQGGFRPIEELFTFSQDHSRGPVENMGKTVAYAEDLGGRPSRLAVTSTNMGCKELEITMPVVPVIEGSEDQFNDCGVRGFPAQGWYEPDKSVLILRIEFLSARDDCDQPEQWLIKRL